MTNEEIKGEMSIWDAMRRVAATGKPTPISREEADAVLSELPTTYPIGRVWTPSSSEELSQALLYVGARYGLATAETVASTLSAYTGTVSPTQSIAERQRIALKFSNGLVSSGMRTRDELGFRLYMLNHAGQERIVWEAEVRPNKNVVIRSRLNR